MIVEAANVSLSLDALLPGADALARREVASALGVREGSLVGLRLSRRSVDARKKGNVHFVTTWVVDLAEDERPNPRKGVGIRPHVPREPLVIPDCAQAFDDSGEARPLVVGTGPAGLFAGLYLAQAGLRPLVIERGAPVEERTRSVEAFCAGGPLDEVTNIQFGEGGAGTFSDGKLNTGTKSPHTRHVLEAFVTAGAPPDILVDAKPHIGTDKLGDVVRALREQIISAGGEVRFYTQLDGLEVCGARVTAALLRDTRTGARTRIDVARVVLACGHSARDTFAALREAGAPMQRKPFAVGVRIEHPQALVNQAQLGTAAGHAALGAADYKLAVHLKDGRGVYTFCMCPGGVVVAAASEEGGVCTNGMSRFARDGANANSALLVSIAPEDLPGSDVLEGVAFQRRLERAAFEAALAATGVPYAAPAQTVGDFLACARGGKQGRGEANAAGEGAGARASVEARTRSSSRVFAGRRVGGTRFVDPTYPRGVAWVDLHECLPPLVSDAIAQALPLLDGKLRGFAHPQAVMTAVEARSSSPVRIVRDEGFQSPGMRGLYPCGEGAGYAGGIMSAAVDGLRVAERIAAGFLEPARSACGSEAGVVRRAPAGGGASAGAGEAAGSCGGASAGAGEAAGARGGESAGVGTSVITSEGVGAIAGEAACASEGSALRG